MSESDGGHVDELLERLEAAEALRELLRGCDWALLLCRVDGEPTYGWAGKMDADDVLYARCIVDEIEAEYRDQVYGSLEIEADEDGDMAGDA